MSTPEAQQPTTPQPTTPTPPAAKPAATVGTAALIVGIIAVLTGLIPVWGVIAGSLAILLGVIALVKKRSRGSAITGLVLGAIAAIASIATTSALVSGLRSIGTDDQPTDTTITTTVEPTATPTPEPTPEPDPTFATQTYTGHGDFVQPVSVSDVVVLTFSCGNCTSNTVLISNSADGLLVNTIGPYSGSHWLNLSSGSMVTEFEITADGDWTLTLGDPTTAAVFDGPASGTGDTAAYILSDSTTAAITNDAGGNFVVIGYGGGYYDLAVNVIGAYSGTVKLQTPAVIQVTSEGSWTITPQ